MCFKFIRFSIYILFYFSYVNYQKWFLTVLVNHHNTVSADSTYCWIWRESESAIFSCNFPMQVKVQSLCHTTPHHYLFRSWWISRMNLSPWQKATVNSSVKSAALSAESLIHGRGMWVRLALGSFSLQLHSSEQYKTRLGKRSVDRPAMPINDLCWFAWASGDEN